MNKKNNINIIRILLYVFLIFLVVIYVLPLLWVVLVSLKNNKELFDAPFSLPEKFQWKNYYTAWSTAHLGRASLNSFIVCSVSLVTSLLISTMASFAIARMKFKLSKTMATYFLIGMMVPVHCVLIPLFKMFSSIGLTNSLLGLMLPYITFSLPMTIFILTGFFRGMPNELFESACIDGCSIYNCFIKIALPLSKTGLFVTGLMSFVANWNELLLAMVFISDKNLKTLPVTLSFFVSPYEVNYTEMFAAIIVAVLPTILVYSLFSNQIVDGLTQGAVKG